MSLPILVVLASLISTAESTAITKRVIDFTSNDVTNKVPEQFHLAPHKFPYEMELKYDLKHSGVEVYSVRFPSPVVSPHAENNTVHAEYFKPKKPGKYPAVIVLDIMDGAALVSRGEAMWLAMNGVPALAMTMPYYGPRCPTEGKHRMISTDVDKSIANVRQAILDGRRAIAWLAAQPEIDSTRLSVVGTSLGSFTGGLLAASEPRIHSACLMLSGGGLVDAYAEHPQAILILKGLRLIGITKEKLRQRIDPLDPLTYAELLKEKKLLFVGPSRDDVVPPAALRRLWEATGKQEILWYDATHVGMAFYVFPAMNAIIEHVKK